MGRSDEAVIRSITGGDSEAFGELIDKYSGLVYAICLSYAKNTEDAKDLTQETFIKAYGIIGDLREPAAFRRWLGRIASSVSINWLRNRRKTLSIDQFDLGAMVVNTVFGTGNGLAERIPGSETNTLIRALDEGLNALPESFRVCIVLKYAEDLSYSQIAEFLDINVITVKNRIHHGKVMLKNRLRKYLSRFQELADSELLATGTHG